MSWRRETPRGSPFLARAPMCCVQTARSVKGSRRRNRTREKRSLREFWRGVPLRAVLREAERSHAARAWIVVCSLIMLRPRRGQRRDSERNREETHCASSSTTRNHWICCSGLAPLPSTFFRFRFAFFGFPVGLGFSTRFPA